GGDARNHRPAAAGRSVGRTTATLRRRRLRRSWARALLARIAVLVEFHEFVFAHGDGGSLRTAFDDRIRDAGGIQRDGAHGVIVAGDHVVDAVGGAVGIDHRDHRDA